MLLKINDLEAQLITSKPVGGMPETAKDQLDKFMVSPFPFNFYYPCSYFEHKKNGKYFNELAPLR